MDVRRMVNAMLVKLMPVFHKSEGKPSEFWMKNYLNVQANISTKKFGRRRTTSPRTTALKWGEVQDGRRARDEAESLAWLSRDHGLRFQVQRAR